MIELCSAKGCWAIPYRGKRRCKPIRLPDGSIVERPTKELQSANLPKASPAYLEILAGGTGEARHGEERVTLFHGLGIIAMLSSGDIAAVYGATPVELGGIE